MLGGSSDSLLHLLWECRKLGAFWSEIISIMGEMYHVKILVSPIVRLLGHIQWCVHFLLSISYLGLPLSQKSDTDELEVSCFAINWWMKRYLDLRVVGLLLKGFNRSMGGQWNKVHTILTNHLIKLFILAYAQLYINVNDSLCNPPHPKYVYTVYRMFMYVDVMSYSILSCCAK